MSDRADAGSSHGQAGDAAPKPEQVGAYRILDTLGEGGMGTVYLAEQQRPVQRRVALKLIKLGMDSKAVVRRFEQERQALALMDHEGIARVFDCGTSDRGQPYFVMELVKGISLDRFCEQQRLSLAERLKLMQQVCAAVQHAHQKGVVHRDLKPGNILVRNVDGGLQVKIIDFGLAKAMSSKLIQESLFTEFGMVMGTPEYMAPEQADPSNLDVDTRADVYSIGVMLYQLLVGELPFSSEDLREAGLLGMQRMLRSAEPPRPSTKLTATGAAGAVAQQLRVSTAALRRALKSDLDWVVVKALEKDRNRRYESANALAQDLQRYLDHEPLEAGPPSALYRLQKLARRYRAQFVAAGLVVLASLAFGSVALVQWRRAERQAADNLELAKANERIAAERGELAAAESLAKASAEAALVERDDALQQERERAAELEQVARFQQQQFERIDPAGMGRRLRASLRDLVRQRGEASAVSEAAALAALAEHDAQMRGVNFTDLAMQSMDQNFFVPGLAAVDEDFADQPLLQARLRHTIARVLRLLGRFDLADQPQQQAFSTRRRLLGDGDPLTLDSMESLGMLRQDQGRLAEAEPLLRGALAARRRVLGEEHPATFASISNLGALLQEQSKLAEAEPLYRAILDYCRRKQGDDSSLTLTAVNNLGGLLSRRGKFEEAEPLLRAGVERSRRVQGDRDPGTLALLSALGQLLVDTGDLAEAEPLLRETVAGDREVRGDEHPSTLAAINNLGGVLWRQGRFEEAEPLFREALQASRRVLGPDHPDTMMSVHNLGLNLLQRGDLAAAEPLLTEALAGSRRRLGDQHLDTVTMINNLGALNLKQGKPSAAEPLLREALAGFRSVLGDGHVQVLATADSLVGCLLSLDRRSDAQALLREWLTTTDLRAGHPGVRAVQTLLERLEGR